MTGEELAWSSLWPLRSLCELQLAAARPPLFTEGNHPRAGREILGTKNPASTHEGVKAGSNRLKKLDFSLIRSMARPLPASHDAGLDESKQAGLLASRSFYSAGLTDNKRQWLIGISSLVTAALPRGIWSGDRTRFPILLKPWFEALVRILHN